MTSPSTSPDPDQHPNEPAPAEPRGALLGSWRVDVTQAAWPILIPATLLTGVGVLGIGAAFVSHGPFAHNDAITFAGSVCMFAGPLTAVIGMRQLLKQDEYVAALEGGLLVVLGSDEYFLYWHEVAGVRFDTATSTLAIEPREGESIVITKPFAMIRAVDLAARLDDLRRKAEFHLIGSKPPPRG